MKSVHQKWLFIAASLFAVLGCVMVWVAHQDPRWNEPVYSGKRLSIWLDKLGALNYFELGNSNNPQVFAVRSIGTNSIPWLLRDLKSKADPLTWRLNQVLKKQSLITYRFPDVNERLSRATRGFWALGELAEPAVPSLLDFVEDTPGYVPEALAGIGDAAVPALRQCLTNTRSYTTAKGRQFIPIPGNTIGAIHNGINAGRISTAAAAVLLPIIREWSQSTNQHAALYAVRLLRDFDK